MAVTTVPTATIATAAMPTAASTVPTGPGGHANAKGSREYRQESYAFHIASPLIVKIILLCFRVFKPILWEFGFRPGSVFNI
jgi:hypothetical protein